jgi:FkbM family methyltransferase
MSDPVIVQHDGLFWPVADLDARPVIVRDCEASIRRLLPYVRGRDCIVQAGANVGVYPLALADHFRSVITAEPEPANFACLSRNIVARDSLKRVTALQAAFGDRETACEPVILESRNCGAHRVAYDVGTVPVWTIDGLELEACDCIWLDIEGAEIFALRGAAQTVARFAPTIAIEDKGHHRAFGVPDGSLQAWFADHGYEQVEKIGHDRVYRSKP